MKISHLLGGTLMLLLLALTGCKTTKSSGGSSSASVEETRFVSEVLSNTPAVEAITAKVKFSLNARGKSLSIGGNLRMKRDDVIQLSMVALGIVEGGRIEFTKDDVLVIDRLHKQYARLPYSDLSFLQKANVDFYTLQALFWNELIYPGHQHLSPSDAQLFTMQCDGSYYVLQGKEQNSLLSYDFYATSTDGRLEKTVVSHTPYTMQWLYQDFLSFQQTYFPSNIQISVEGLSQPASIAMKLSNLSTSTDWETRTQVSSKYTQVTEQQILERILKLTE